MLNCARWNSFLDEHPAILRVWNHPITEFLKSQWFFYVLAIFIVIARFAPNFARDGGLIKGEYSIGYGAVAWIFLQSGLSMKTSRLMANMTNWRAHLTILVLSFLVTSSIVYGICCGIKAANDKNIDDWVLIGLLMTAACPTTVASNVLMTTEAGGNDLLCVCEVFIGNLLGAFITPALSQLYTDRAPFEYGNPANGNSIGSLYGRVMKQVGLSVFVPLTVGQIAQNMLPKPTKIYLDFLKKYKLKIGSYMLLLIMFSSFSTAFYQKSFTSVPHATIIFVCFFNLGIYLFFTLISYAMARPFFIPILFNEVPDESSSKFYTTMYKIFRPFYYNKRDTVCILFCGPAKTAALGVSLITSQYGDNKSHLGKLLLPLVLYQSIQVLTASLLVLPLRKWCADEQPDITPIESTDEKAIEQDMLSSSRGSSDIEKNDCIDENAA
ncbi:putative membrane protein [Nakaseomyces glabratus]|uniref:Putative membrane protein n=1 Tax=Candida glabrata TaxID=5478 RepID=A0A0W0CTN0_CANGB|nr:putative membrane protein [Nakaseomyces glabratus]KTB02781.1 putative membrane protein [Nakaseomyces glabratus]KTB05039.1 putative membrane protein [Nakaseomyces glabratus]KTB18711.1 putative membrane protein [Nakaseomyces glabratus]